jgi:hypothetical protein
MFTKALEAIENEVEEIPHKFFLSSSLPIPYAHNQVLKRAYDDPQTYTHFLLMEEDVCIPKGGLQKMFDLNADIAIIDYAVSGYSCAPRTSKGQILWCGTGMTLIKRKVLDALPYPWFRTDKALQMNDWRWVNVNPDLQYGKQDIRFGCDVRKLGFIIKEIECMECWHLELRKLGQVFINDGCHKIGLKSVIEQHPVYDPPIGI